MVLSRTLASGQTRHRRLLDAGSGSAPFARAKLDAPAVAAGHNPRRYG